MINIQKGFNYKEVECIVNEFNNNHCKFDHICFCMFENRKCFLFEKELKWRAFQNQHKIKLIEKIKTPESCYFISHHNYIVYNADMKKLINKLNPQQIYLAVIFSSDVFIFKKTIDIFDDGVINYVIEYLSTSLHGQEDHKNGEV
nr:cysteine hydrolase [Francisella persica]